MFRPVSPLVSSLRFRIRLDLAEIRDSTSTTGGLVRACMTSAGTSDVSETSAGNDFVLSWFTAQGRDHGFDAFSALLFQAVVARVGRFELRKHMPVLRHENTPTGGTVAGQRVEL